jgi:hypothetical protein
VLTADRTGVAFIGAFAHTLGRMERLSDVFGLVRLTVTPLGFGAGLKDKVLRSMAAGLPCIGTAEAFSGMAELPMDIVSMCQSESYASQLAVAKHRYMPHGGPLTHRTPPSGWSGRQLFYDRSEWR